MTFADCIQLKKDVMKIKDLEVERAFSREMITYRESADSWRLKFSRLFAKQEKERQAQFLEAEKAREKKFLQTSQEQQTAFDGTLTSLQESFYALVGDLEKKAYESEAVRMKHTIYWAHQQKDKLKAVISKWRKEFSALEEQRMKTFSAMLQAAQADRK